MTREDCNDVVSRKAVIDLILEDAVRTGIEHRYTSIQNMNNEINEVRSLPPATPACKKGKWIDTTEISTNKRGQIVHEVICSKCNGISYFRSMGNKYIGANLCPDCGGRNGERMSSLIGVDELINKINDTYKGYMLEEQYSPLSFKNMVEELAEKTTINAILIPEGATNGDMIKAMFPNGKEYDNDGDVRYEIEIDFDYSFCSYFDGAWWNAPYKGGCNLSEKSTGSESEDKE